jgi:Helix-turn-helix domain
MGQDYRHFSLEERCELARLHAEGRSLRQIAAALDRAPSSITRELTRNRGSTVGYKPSYADERAKARRWTGSKLDRSADLRQRVLTHLTHGHSPEQTAGRIARETGNICPAPRPSAACAAERAEVPQTTSTTASRSANVLPRSMTASPRPLGSRPRPLRQIRPGDPHPA